MVALGKRGRGVDPYVVMCDLKSFLEALEESLGMAGNSLIMMETVL